MVADSTQETNVKNNRVTLSRAPNNSCVTAPLKQRISYPTPHRKYISTLVSHRLRNGTHVVQVVFDEHHERRSVTGALIRNPPFGDASQLLGLRDGRPDPARYLLPSGVSAFR
jgi:hypothetical protein